MTPKLYLFSFGAGLLVRQRRVRSAHRGARVRGAHPTNGEQAVPMIKRVMQREAVTLGWVRQQCGEHVLGELPKASAATDGTQRATRT